MGGRAARPAAAAAGADVQLRGSAPRGADGASPVPPVVVPSTGAVDADRLSGENYQPAASTPASASVTTSEIPVLPRTPPRFLAAAEGDVATVENSLAEGDGADLRSGVGKQSVATMVTDSPLGSDGASPRQAANFGLSFSLGGRRTLPTSARIGAAPPTPLPQAAMFRVADGAVAEAADAAAPPRPLNPAAAETSADADEARGVRVAASAAVTADADLAVSPPALPSPSTSPTPMRPLDAESSVALSTARGFWRAAARIVAAHDAPVALARRLRAAALACIARRARGAAARAIAAAAGADAAAAELVHLPPDGGGNGCGSGGAAVLCAPGAGARAPSPTPAAKRRVREAPDSESGQRSASAAGARPVGMTGRTRGDWLRAADVAPPLVPGATAGLISDALPAVAPAADGKPGVRRAPRDSLAAGGVPAAPQPDGWRAVRALRSTFDDLSCVPVAASPPGASIKAPGAAPSAAPPGAGKCHRVAVGDDPPHPPPSRPRPHAGGGGGSSAAESRGASVCAAQRGL